MLSENDFDKFKLLELLRVSHPNPSFWHGQVKRAASQMLKEYGYHWTFISLEHSIEEKKRLKGLEKSLRRTIFEATEGWHSNKSMVWRRVRDYTKKVGIRLEAKRLVDKIRTESMHAG